MGLLTDPSAGQGKLTKALVKYHPKLTILLYISGVIWFCLLAYTPINAGTYFSENALLPGLVTSKFRDDGLARQYYDELQYEMKKYNHSIPYPWILAKFRQMGLDTYTHNFSLNYPLGRSAKKFSGKNVYAILRAARAASTEALVMSVPFRPPSNIHLTTTPSIAIMLAFAKSANKEKYWSKDIIFLITEHEQLGVQAWLEAYHNVPCGQEGILEHGDLRGRGGAIQAAINLEFHHISIAKMDIKIEGLNGQLPNLDLFNLATRMCTKEGILHTFKNRENQRKDDKGRSPLHEWLYSFRTLMAMVFSQATGIPNGNHGLFHRFGIQALTLEGFSPKQVRSNQSNFITVGRILEGIFRSLNNLLERFHQSYFFYLLPSSERFVSIGLYMPAMCLVAGALFVKACGTWCKLQQNPLSSDSQDSEDCEDSEKSAKEDGSGDYSPIDNKVEETNVNEEDEENFDIVQIGSIFLLTHTLGIILMNSPTNITRFGTAYGFSSDISIYGGFALSSLVLLIAPAFVTIRSSYKNMTVINILSLLELGTALICLSMYNFSLGFLAGTLYVPLALIIIPSNCRLCSFIQKTLWILVHPLIVLTTAVLIYTFSSFAGEPFKENILRGLGATQQAIVFSIVDSMIYSNWLYSVVTCVMIPNWLCFWIALFCPSKPKHDSEVDIIKKND